MDIWLQRCGVIQRASPDHKGIWSPFRLLRIECDRCGKVQMVNEAHARWRDRTLRAILARMRHDGCGGLAGKAELLSGIDGVSSRPVRRIALRER